ncbi:hypothetical protein SC171_19825 [Pantoea cypripedii]|uniref:OTU domain-containing protein n=1 Tax=Pantoea cypripedii TaxID=55209 RepID=UPI002FCC04CD
MPDFHNVHSLVNFNHQSTLSSRPPALKKITTVASLNNTNATISSRIMPPPLRPERNLSSATSQSFPFRNHAESKFTRSIQKIAPFSIAQKRPSSVMEITRGRTEQVKSKRFDPGWGASDILKSGSEARHNAKVKKSIQKNATQLLEKLSLQTKEKSESEKAKENLLSCIREEGRWDHDGIDIAVYALANTCKARIRVYDADVGMIADAGHEQNSQHIINLQRVRIRGYEHYQFIDNAGYVHDVEADGNCLFRAVSMALYGDQDSWIYLRGQTADHVENHYEIYREFVRVAPLELAAETTGQEKKLEDLLPDLTLSKPHVKDTILDNFLTTLQKDLRSFIGRSATPEKIVCEKDQRILRNVLHHFLSIYDASRFQGIKETIAYLPPVQQKRILGRLQYRIERAQDGEYNLELNEQASRQKVREMASLKILANAITHDLVTVLTETGISPHQLLAFIELTEAATLIQEGQLLGTALEDLGEIVREMEKDPDLPENCQRIREPAVQEQIDNLKECFEKDLIELAHFVNNVDFEGHFFLNEQQLDENYSAENYNYTDKLEDVLAREGVIKEHLIANRVRRLLEHLHLQRLPMNNLHEDAAYNSPLFMTRSVINPEERGLYYDGRLSVKNLKHHLRNNRAARMASLRQHMIGAPFILGAGTPVTSMNLDGLDYGDKGLSYKFLYQELIDNRNISIIRLNRIGLWSNTLIPKITKTGTLDFHWMDDFPDDVIELLFHAFRNPEQNGDHDSLLLFNSLQRIGKKLNGETFDEHQFGKLIQDGLHPYTLERLSLKLDELAYLLFLFPHGGDGGRGILDIAALINQQPVEGEIPYHPHADWKKLVTSLALDKTYRTRLEERLQVLQTAIDDIPWERLCHYLARHTNIRVVEQNQIRDFVADYQPSGVVNFTPPANLPNEPWLLLCPDYLEVYDDQGVSVGEFYRFENTNFSALRALIESEATIFNDTHGRFPDDTENREALERLAKKILAMHNVTKTDQKPV